MHDASLHGDVEWYRQKAIDSGGRVLEIGAGTGRVTIPIAEAGVRVTALDLDRGMLDRLREKVAKLPGDVQSRIALHQADMRSFSLNQQAALVIIPFRAFLHNLTREDQIATLRRAHVHLRPGGELALNVFHPSLEYMAANAGAYAGVWRARMPAVLEGGGFVVYSEMSRYDTVRQRVHSLIRTEHFSSDGSLVRTHMMNLQLAYLYSADIKSLLEETGFELIRVSGDFTGRPFNNDADELVVEAVRRQVPSTRE
jgi:ubiquinone/menaquinone biosynthesis C-methylase UbiE